ncbi:hypothetical protein [Bradyrhizobium yuanmingense]|uniref:hypothetical protein n=1 Tax=Bradyrhizobium yuanmingense TaxID=108015 RepID=UPI001CD46BED|nr:hypothetical protein [Bradyrhizobium yuanmingense]
MLRDRDELAAKLNRLFAARNAPTCSRRECPGVARYECLDLHLPDLDETLADVHLPLPVSKPRRRQRFGLQHLTIGLHGRVATFAG